MAGRRNTDPCQRGWARAWKLPFLFLFGLRLARGAEFDVFQSVIPKKREDDVALPVAADAEGVQRFMANFPLFKVGVDGIGARKDFDVRQCILLLCPDGGAEDLRPLAEMRGQIFKPSPRPALAALADVHAVCEIEGEGIAVAVFPALAEGAQVGDQFVAAHAVGVQVRGGKCHTPFPDRRVHCDLPPVSAYCK